VNENLIIKVFRPLADKGIPNSIRQKLKLDVVRPKLKHLPISIVIGRESVLYSQPEEVITVIFSGQAVTEGLLLSMRRKYSTSITKT